MERLRIIIFSLLVALSANSYSQYFEDAEDFVIKDYKYDDFTKIEAEYQIKVNYKSLPDSAGCVVIQGKREALKNLLVKSEKNVFTAKLKKKVVTPDTITIDVYSNGLTAIETKGTALVNILSSIDAPEISFRTDGESLITAKEVNCGIFKCKCGDTSNIVINGGKCGTSDLTMSGRGSIAVFNMTTESSTVIITGNGDVRCQASTDLNVTISGNGKLYYTGSPRIRARIPSPSQIAAF